MVRTAPGHITPGCGSQVGVVRRDAPAQYRFACAGFEGGGVDLPVCPLSAVAYGVVPGVPAETEHWAAAEADDTRGLG